MLDYLKNIEQFVRDQHFGHKIWNVSISAPYSQNGRNEGLIEVSYTDEAWHKKAYMFVYNQAEGPNEEICNVLYVQDGLVIFDDEC